MGYLATAGVKLGGGPEKYRFRAATEYMHIIYHKYLITSMFYFHPESCSYFNMLISSISFILCEKMKCLPSLKYGLVSPFFFSYVFDFTFFVPTSAAKHSGGLIANDNYKWRIRRYIPWCEHPPDHEMAAQPCRAGRAPG